MHAVADMSLRLVQAAISKPTATSAVKTAPAPITAARAPTPAPAPAPAVMKTTTAAKPATPAAAAALAYKSGNPTWAQLAAGSVPWAVFTPQVLSDSSDEGGDASVGQLGLPSFIQITGPAGATMYAALESPPDTNPAIANFLIQDPYNGQMYYVIGASSNGGYAQLSGPYQVPPDDSWAKFLTVAAIGGAFVGGALSAAGEFADTAATVSVDGTATTGIDAAAPSMATAAPTQLTTLTDIPPLQAPVINTLDTNVVSLDGVGTAGVDAPVQTAAEQSLERVVVTGTAIAAPAVSPVVVAGAGAAAVGTAAAVASHGSEPTDPNSNPLDQRLASGQNPQLQGVNTPGGAAPTLADGTPSSTLDSVKTAASVAGTGASAAGTIAKLLGSGTAEAATPAGAAGRQARQWYQPARHICQGLHRTYQRRSY